MPRQQAFHEGVTQIFKKAKEDVEKNVTFAF